MMRVDATPYLTPSQEASLEYRAALDLCASIAHSTGGTPAIFASSTFYLRELLFRLPDAVVILWPASDTTKVPLANSTIVSRLKTKTTRNSNLPDLECSMIRVVIWAEPDEETCRRILECALRVIPNWEKLIIVTSGPLAGRLPEWGNPITSPVPHPLGLRRTLSLVRNSSLEVERVYGFRGALATMLAVASTCLSFTGFHRLSDRCYHAMRGTYVVVGAGARASPVAVSVVRRCIGKQRYPESPFIRLS